MNALDRWEAEAKETTKANIEYLRNEGIEVGDDWIGETDKRILALIHIVRKKDTALEVAVRYFPEKTWVVKDKKLNATDAHIFFKEALLLTENLK